MVALIKYIESCIKLTGCSWSDDPCNKYKTMTECFNNADCKWGNLEYPPDSPIELGFGDGLKPQVQLKDNTQPGPPPYGELCKGRNYEPCYFYCAIF